MIVTNEDNGYFSTIAAASGAVVWKGVIVRLAAGMFVYDPANDHCSGSDFSVLRNASTGLPKSREKIPHVCLVYLEVVFHGNLWRFTQVALLSIACFCF